jgi:hypothetical protein
MNLESVTFWLNAFIPNSVCEVKKDMFVLAIPINITGAPIPTIRFFAGDQREFSNDISASARMHAAVRIEGLSSDNPTIASEQNICGESIEVDDAGNELQRATAKTDRMKFLNLRGSQTTDPEGGVVDDVAGSVQIDLIGSANLPLLTGAPDIDYSGTLLIDRAEGNIVFKGAVSGFPAFEIYFQANDGDTVTLGQLSPISPIDLIGEENRAVNVSARLVI